MEGDRVMDGSASTDSTRRSHVTWLIAGVCVLAVALGARPYAGSWNDGSRLAAVESLADRHTFTIDDSIFCHPSAALIAEGHPPYAPSNLSELNYGTRDKLYIGGHFYSDKPAVISLLMAGVYRFAQMFGLPTAAERPDLFCWLLTVLSSGLSLAVAATCLYRIGQMVGLGGWTLWAWLGSFVLATMALTYTRFVNNHVMLLGVMAALSLQLTRLAGDITAGTPAWGRLVLLGTLAGLGFNLDFGSGPLLCVAVFGCIAWRTRRVASLAVFMLAALPWVAAGAGINYAIGGVWKPMNMVPEYSQWPGCPFDLTNMTGVVHNGPVEQAQYALSLLFGMHGFVTHNLPLFLAAPAAVLVFRGRSPHRTELLFTLGWCAAAWLMYGVLSNNHGGVCCSVRWFLPFLAPMYCLIALAIRDDAALRAGFFLLSGWGLVLGAIMWIDGPWSGRVTPLLWPIVGLALSSWLGLGVWRRATVAATNRSRSRSFA
jgi:hypothetical protein